MPLFEPNQNHRCQSGRCAMAGELGSARCELSDRGSPHRPSDPPVVNATYEGPAKTTLQLTCSSQPAERNESRCASNLQLRRRRGRIIRSHTNRERERREDAHTRTESANDERQKDAPRRKSRRMLAHRLLSQSNAWNVCDTRGLTTTNAMT
jgi:hypothetical protein